MYAGRHLERNANDVVVRRQIGEGQGLNGKARHGDEKGVFVAVSLPRFGPAPKNEAGRLEGIEIAALRGFEFAALKDFGAVRREKFDLNLKRIFPAVGKNGTNLVDKIGNRQRTKDTAVFFDTSNGIRFGINRTG